MEADRFDSLARSLTDTRSRRGVVTTVLGSALGLLGLTETMGKKKKGKRGKKGKKDKQTPPATAAPSAPVCPAERHCASGCCPEGAVCLNGTDCCTDNAFERCQTADVHCGEIRDVCGRPINCGSCAPPQYCRDGGCTCRTPGEPCGPSSGGETCCSGRCGPSGDAFFCRQVICSPSGFRCTDSTDCCRGVCVPTLDGGRCFG